MFIAGGEGGILVASLNPSVAQADSVSTEEAEREQEETGLVMDFSDMEPEEIAPITTDGFEVIASVAESNLIADEDFRGIALTRSYIEFFRSVEISEENGQDGLTVSEIQGEIIDVDRARSLNYLQDHYNVQDYGVTGTLSLYDPQDFKAGARPTQSRRYDLIRLGSGLERNAGHAPGINAAEGNQLWPEASSAVDTLEALAAARLQQGSGVPFGEQPTWGGLNTREFLAQTRTIRSTQDLLEFTAQAQSRRALLQTTIERYQSLGVMTAEQQRIVDQARQELPILARAEQRGLRALQRRCRQGLPDGHFSTWSDEDRPTVEPNNEDGSINPDYTRAMLVMEMARRARASA